MAREASDHRRPNTHPDIVCGLVYAHNWANANTAEVHRACATVRAAVDLLADHGVLDRELLEARRQETAEQLRRQYLAQGMDVAVQEFAESKYAFQHGAEVDWVGD